MRNRLVAISLLGVGLIVASSPRLLASSSPCTAQIHGGQSWVCGPADACEDDADCASRFFPAQNKVICICPEAADPHCCYPAGRVHPDGSITPDGIGLCDSQADPPCIPDGICRGGFKPGTNFEVQAECD